MCISYEKINNKLTNAIIYPMNKLKKISLKNLIYSHSYKT